MKEEKVESQEKVEKPAAETQAKTEEGEAPSNKEASAEEKINELNDRYLRLYSEFDNYRKRTAKEKIDWIKTAGEDLFKVLIPVVDDFERAIKLNSEVTDVKAINEGFLLIYNKLKNNLTQKGLEEMKAQGSDFNPDMHEALTNIPAPSEDLKGKVIEEVEKGYLLNGKIIRYAKVVVGN